MTVKSKKRTISTVCLCLLFILTTALGLGTLSPIRVYADDSSASAVHSLKFKQVAVGEDFAIMLTYDGDLYGMSLLDKTAQDEAGDYINGNNTTGYNTNGKTLGQYYPSTPIKIDVTFTDVKYQATTSNGETVYNDIAVGIRPDDTAFTTYEKFDTTAANRTIKSIVATRKTAAFITENNLIYTWGAEIDEPTKGTPKSMNLLLRDHATAGSNYQEAAHKFLPSMINYLTSTAEDDFSSTGTTSALLPFKNKFLANVYAFTASEYNYNLFYSAGQEADGTNGTPKNFVWGQAVYYQQSSSHEFSFGDASILSQIIGTSGTYLQTQAFLGDGNVYYVAGGKVYARGKNFSVTSAAVDTGIVNTLSSAPTDASTGLLRTTGGSDASSGYRQIPNALMGFTEVSSSAPKLTTAQNVFVTSSDLFYDSQGNVKKLKDSQGNDVDVTLSLPTFSAGAGYGYLIDSSGKVQSWGKIGNLATLPSAKNGAGANYTQVVAGKILTGLPVINGIDNSYNDRIIDDETYKDIASQWATKYTELNSAYVDGNTALSAALTGTGQIEVFGVLDGVALNISKAVAVREEKSDNTNNKFAAIFGGYGNNLFAISNIGKLYRITATSTTECNATPIDTFTTWNSSTSTANPINNWSVATTGNNAPVINFADGYQTQNENGKWVSNYTASVSLSGVTTTKAEGITEDKVTVEKNGKVIGVNYSADAYRLILPNRQSAANNLLSLPSGLSLSTDSTKPDNVTEKVEGEYADFGDMLFYWDGNENPIPLDVALQYVNIAYTFDSEAKEIGFTITPKKSTQKKTMRIKYWVGRYDTTANFDGNEEFYDFKQAEVCVKIGDTKSTRHFTAAINPALGEDNNAVNNNSRVPLLDPNNPYNNTYSIAAMDVSEGFEKVFEKMKSILGGFDDESASADLYKALSGLDKDGNPSGEAADPGFPAKAKIAAGTLKYYNSKADDFYNNKYEYFIDETDDDVFNVGSCTAGGAYYTSKAQTVNVSILLTNITADSLEELKNNFTATTTNGGMPYFANPYGLTIAFEGFDETAQTVTLKFTYSVLLITATGAMPASGTNLSLTYQGNDISQPLTPIANGTVRGAGINVSLRRNGENTDSVLIGDDSTSGNLRTMVDVYTQPSLRFADKDITGKDVIGKPSDKPADVVYHAAEITLELASSPAQSGQRKDEYTFSFSRLFGDLGNIRVAYNGETGDAAFRALEATFGQNGQDAYYLTDVRRDSLTIKAQKATIQGSEYSFRVQLRRFYEGSLGPVGLTYQGEPAEVAYVQFTVKVTVPGGDSFMTLKKPTDQDEIRLVGDTKELVKVLETKKTPQTLDQSVNFGTEDNYGYILNTLYGKEFTVETTSSNPTVVTAAFNKETKGIELDPKTSGTAYIRYTVKLYSYTIQDSFKVTVNTLTMLNKTVSVITDETVYYSDLITYLNAVSTITGTLTPKLNSVYFEEAARDASIPDNEKVWTKLPSRPAFLGEVYYAGKEYFVLRMGQYDPDQLDLSQKITRCVVVFETTSAEYRAAFKVAPGAQTAKDNARTLLIGIDKAKKSIRILSSDTQDGSLMCEGNTYTIPATFLAPKIYNYNRGNYEIIAAQAVSADGYTNYSKYLDVAMDAEKVILTPKYPTAELKNMDGCNLQVSLKSDKGEVTLLNFTVSVTGIKTVLTKSEYTTLILATFFAVLAFLVIIFFIRLAIYWKKKAEQRKIIRKNQMLIRMRDKMHNKTEAVSKEKLVRTKLKMEDPKYAKMFTEMRQNKEAQTGITLENSTVAQKAENRVKAEKASKKKGKKSIDELKAELEAKRAAFAAMQSGEVPEGGIPVDGMQMDQSIMGDAPVFTDAVYNDGLSGEDIDAQIKTHISSEDIVFDPMNPDDIDNNL